MANEELNTVITTGKVRFSYVHVFDKVKFEEDGKEQYSASIIIPKSDTKTIAAIKKAIENAKELGKSKLSDKNGKMLPDSKLWNPLRDGDEERPDDEAYADSYFLTAKSSRQPKVVNKQRQEVLTADQMYSGVFGYASLSFYAFNVKSKGIGCGLNCILTLGEGEELAGGISTDAAFDGLFDDGSDSDDLFGL